MNSQPPMVEPSREFKRELATRQETVFLFVALGVYVFSMFLPALEDVSGITAAWVCVGALPGICHQAISGTVDSDWPLCLLGAHANLSMLAGMILLRGRTLLWRWFCFLQFAIAFVMAVILWFVLNAKETRQGVFSIDFHPTVGYYVWTASFLLAAIVTFRKLKREVAMNRTAQTELQDSSVERIPGV